jgi:RNA polymerase sigma factor (sigma-70 family)
MPIAPDPRVPAGSGESFATTRWTVVLAARQMVTPEAGRALETLCRTYWMPLYAFARRQGHAPADAEDLTQGFFAEFLRRNSLEGLNRDRGRFRAFLLAAFKHFLANEWDRAHRLKRGGGVVLLPLDAVEAESLFQDACANTPSPDRAYDRTWVLTLLDVVLQRLQAELTAAGRAEAFEHLKAFLTLDAEARPYLEVARALGMSEGAVKVAVHRIRRRYRELLRAEVAQTLARPEQVEEELAALMAAFGD